MDYTISIRPHDDSGPALTAVVSMSDGRQVVRELTVFPGANGAVAPEVAVGTELSALLGAMAVALTSGALGSCPEPPPKVEKVQRRRPPELAVKPAKSLPRSDVLPKDIGPTYWRLGTIAKVASHYGVDKHTARKWISQLRKGGNRRLG